MASRKKSAKATGKKSTKRSAKQKSTSAAAPTPGAPSASEPPPASPRPARRRPPRSTGASTVGPPRGPGATPVRIDPLTMPTADLEQALASGEHAALLRETLGDALYDELRSLRGDDRRHDLRRAPELLILPGIMGSKLGYGRGLLGDTVWLDPFDVARGNLERLRLPERGKRRIEAVDVFAIYYLLLRYRLRAAGFAAEFWPYDWRQSLPDLGRRLASHVKRGASDRRVLLVAHSMGGLVARAALVDPAASERIERVVQLGTPNRGSFVPMRALTALHESVRQVAALDLTNTAEELVEKVFSTFPGLHELLPLADAAPDPDIYRATTWPEQLRPNQAMLDRARAAQAALPAPDERFRLIAGVNQPTIVAARATSDGFRYLQSNAGDGTVPLTLATWPGLQTWYAEKDHGGMPNSRSITAATIDLLRTGTTEKLPQRWDGMRTPPTEVRDAAATPFDGRRGAASLTRAEQRDVLAAFARVASPADLDSVAATSAGADGRPAESAGLRGVLVGRRRQHRLDVRLAHRSITDVDADAYVLGAFRGVRPEGAAAAIDAAMDGALSDFLLRQMFTADAGEVFTLPSGRRSLQAHHVMFLGLGDFASFGPPILELAAENAIRTLIHTRVCDIATVMIGANSNVNTRKALHAMLTGFVRGLIEADAHHDFRRVTLAEVDADRYAELCDLVQEFAFTPLFEDVEICVTELPAMPPAPLRAAASPRSDPNEETRYLYVRQIAAALDTADDDCIVLPDPNDLRFTASLLSSGSHATVLHGERAVTLEVLDAALGRLQVYLNAAGRRFDALEPHGRALAELVLPEEIRVALATSPEVPLVVIHDEPSSRVPWETLLIGAAAAGSSAPALTGGLARRYLARDLSAAKWSETRRLDAELHVLLIVDPTDDLVGAEAEGERMDALFQQHDRIRVTHRRKREASRSRLLEDFASGRFDVVHYAGHAFFDAQRPERSGLLCHDHVPLTALDVAHLRAAPALLFANACESGRIRSASRNAVPTAPGSQRLAATVSFAEALLRGGVGQYVGTHWPVGDAAAKTFADVFYTALLRGEPVGTAVDAGRKALYTAREIDWANYIHYGPRTFRVKVRA